MQWVDRYDHDTIAMAVVGADGSVVSGTSTNGARHKVHGRVGDSPIAGAGSYARASDGGCGGTGDGDIMVRFLPCYQVGVCHHSHACSILCLRVRKPTRRALVLPWSSFLVCQYVYEGAAVVSHTHTHTHSHTHAHAHTHTHTHTNEHEHTRTHTHTHTHTRLSTAGSRVHVTRYAPTRRCSRRHCSNLQVLPRLWGRHRRR
jgi:hypothetical protein